MKISLSEKPVPKIRLGDYYVNNNTGEVRRIVKFRGRYHALFVETGEINEFAFDTPEEITDLFGELYTVYPSEFVELKSL